MGEGGYLILRNETSQDWVFKSQHSYQMNNWNWPEIVKANTSEKVYIEWNDGIGIDSDDDAGEADFQLAGTEYRFQIQARSMPRRLQVYFSNLSAINCGKGGTPGLGWRHNGEVTFLLGELAGGNYVESCN
jgi:hypothetical protein